jgi:hypothetical protein
MSIHTSNVQQMLIIGRQLFFSESLLKNPQSVRRSMAPAIILTKVESLRMKSGPEQKYYCISNVVYSSGDLQINFIPLVSRPETARLRS